MREFREFGEFGEEFLLIIRKFTHGYLPAKNKKRIFCIYFVCAKNYIEFIQIQHRR